MVTRPLLSGVARIKVDRAVELLHAARRVGIEEMLVSRQDNTELVSKLNISLPLAGKHTWTP